MTGLNGTLNPFHIHLQVPLDKSDGSAAKNLSGLSKSDPNENRRKEQRKKGGKSRVVKTGALAMFICIFSEGASNSKGFGTYIVWRSKELLASLATWVQFLLSYLLLNLVTPPCCDFQQLLSPCTQALCGGPHLAFSPHRVREVRRAVLFWRCKAPIIFPIWIGWARTVCRLKLHDKAPNTKQHIQYIFTIMYNSSLFWLALDTDLFDPTDDSSPT